MRAIDHSKERISSNDGGKERKQRGTTISETSEDLALRLQRLLCEDDFISEADDSTVTHEISSAIYSFSEDSDFDTSLMKRQYKSLDRPKKTPATLAIPKSSRISIEESSDDEVFGKQTKFDYRKYYKTM